MGRHFRVLSAAAFAGLAGVVLFPESLSAQSSPSTARPEMQTARASRTTLTGVVTDERGGPVTGATVSALGATMALAVTDQRGRFAFLDLPHGEYFVRAHLTGFAASRREFVRIGPSVATVPLLQLRRLDHPAPSPGPVDPAIKGRTILAAGFEAPAEPAGTPAATAGSAGTKDDHPHTETAWRLRHIKRSILKDSAREILVTADNEPRGSAFGRAFGSAGSFATALFTDLPFSGEVNVLTTSAFAPGGFVLSSALPRGVAYLSLGAPSPAGDWLVRAAMSEGDVASWIVAGSFVARRTSTHAYTVGLSYSTQQYQGGNPAALAAVTDTSRNVGEVYAYDSWKLSPIATLDFGGRYSRFDYLQNRGMLSPRATFTLEPFKGTRISSSVTQQMVAPGAEEFLPSRIAGPWLPPERTFAPLFGSELRAERTRYLDVGLEQHFSDSILGVRRFIQSVDDQLATLFAISTADSPRAVGHYYVHNLGAVDANGWGVRLSSRDSARIHAIIDYTLTRARWIARNDGPSLLAVAPALVRAEREDIHDITTTLKTDIPETATRVFVLYKINSAYTRHRDPSKPGLDGRFDVQVNQALPFGLAGTEWEILFGLRNLFRDPADAASIYDELLVTRPPKRVVGGFLVRF